MNLNPRPSHRCRAFTLIELLTYIAVVGVVTSVTVSTVFQLMKQTRDLRRNCDDIARTTHAGERWRADIRAAVAEPTTETSPDGMAITIPTVTGVIVYALSKGTLWRQSDNERGDVTREPVLHRVKTAQLEPENRGEVIGWRWEIELRTRREGGPVKPIFSFLAVPGYSHRK